MKSTDELEGDEVFTEKQATEIAKETLRRTQDDVCKEFAYARNSLTRMAAGWQNAGGGWRRLPKRSHS